MVLLPDPKYCIAEIACILDTSENTVRQCMKRYERDGIEGLDYKPRTGRPPIVLGDVKAAIYWASDMTAETHSQAWT
jgi:transposase